MPFTLDWSTASNNGSHTATDGGDTLGFTIASTANGAGQIAGVRSTGTPAAEGLWVSSLTDQTTSTITFDQAVENLNFEIFDIDQSAGSWDDRLTIIATAADGSQQVVNYSDLDGLHTATGNVLDADGSFNGGVETFGAEDSVTVDIPGPITGLTFIFDHGESHTASGTFGVSDITFDLAPDYIVEGTAGADLIDTAYVGDPEGDRVDNSDAADGSNDDVIVAGAGDDVIVDSAGDDTIDAGLDEDTIRYDTLTGNDTVVGGEGGEFDDGGTGDKLDFHNYTGAMDVDFTGDEAGTITTATGSVTFTEIEHILGGTGADSFDASAATTRLVLDGGEGADTIQGGSGDDYIAMGLTQDFSTTDGDNDTLILEDGFGDDQIEGFETPTANGDGTFTGRDQVDVTGLTSDGGTTPVNTSDVVVSDTNGDGTGDAILTFPGGESITLLGVSPTAVDSEAELVAMGIPAAPPGLDYIVEGTSGADVIDAAYTGDPEGDMVDANDNLAGNNDDVILGGAGGDTITGGAGNDTIYGDAGEGNLITNGDFSSGLTGWTVNNPTGGTGPVAGGGDVSFNSADEGVYGDSIEQSFLSGIGIEHTLSLDLIENNVGTGDHTFEIAILDENGNVITTETHTVSDGTTEPVSIVFFPTTGTSTVRITNTSSTNTISTDGKVDNVTVYATGAGDDDVIDGGAGQDEILGGAGADTLTSFGDGDSDRVSGGDDADTIIAGGGDTVDGGAGGVDNDTLDLTGTAPTGGYHNVVITGADSNGNGSDGYVEFYDATDTLVGTLNFTEIENITGAQPNLNYIVEGTAGADDINLSYTGDPEGDRIDNSDALDGSNDDVVRAGDGADNIDSGVGDDTIFGEGGDDEIFLDNTLQNDTIDGGSTTETLGDRINSSSFTTGLTVNITSPENGTITDGLGNTTTFTDIERWQMGAGDDVVNGSDGVENLIMGAGDDVINAGGGDDIVFSGFDNDTVDGGAGNDTLWTSSGADTVTGGIGNDSIDVGPGDGEVDTVVMADGHGQDTVSSFEAPIDNGDGTYTGRDQLDVTGLHDAGGILVNTDDVTITDTNGDGTGSAILTFPNGEAITLIGISPADVSDPLALVAMGIPLAPNYIVEGTAGDDNIDVFYTGGPEGDLVDANDNLANTNDDVIEAYGGNDTISSGLGDDNVDAGSGDDTVYGGAGNDTVQGGTGIDTIFGQDGDDTIRGGDGNDVLDGDDAVAGNDTIYGDAGDDVIIGDGGDDFLYGGADNDDIYASGGNNYVEGGSGDDEVFMGTGDDTIYGGTGVDSISGGAGADTIYTWDDGTEGDRVDAGDDRDTIYAGINDRVDGGEGGDDFDTLVIQGPATIDYDPLNSENGTVTYWGGAGTMTFTNIENITYIPCFTPGTMISTDKGMVAVEKLAPGDKVWTRDSGYQEIRWAGARKLDGRTLRDNPDLNPVMIKAGALGGDLPKRDMLVSPQHRMVIANVDTQLLFGEDEVLVAAKHLTHLEGVEQLTSLGVTYIHIMFERHEIVEAEGALTESFQPGDVSMAGIDCDQRRELLRIFPSLHTREGRAGFMAARMSLKQHEAELLRIS